MVKKDLKIAVVGATGNVGRKMLNILSERGFDSKCVYAVASQKSKGKQISFGDDDILTVESLEEFDFSKVKVALFSPGGAVSKMYAGKAVNMGCFVIDNTSYFRQNADVPLIVPEINPLEIKNSKLRIIANPNCAIIPIAMTLSCLHKVIPVKRVVTSTYQSVSGAGKNAMDELETQVKSIFTGSPKVPQVFKRPIAFNVIPQIDVFEENGYTMEEIKMHNEIKKILDMGIELSATCVRVPVFIGHSSSVNAEFERPFEVQKAREILKKSKGIRLSDEKDFYDYMTPMEVSGKDEVFVSRLRKDMSSENGLSFWTVSDNLRKGAALNAVQILELLLEHKQL